MKYMIIILAIVLSSLAPTQQFFFGHSEKVDKGMKQLAVIQSNSQWSDCWKEAISNLEEGCKSKNSDESRSKLAVALANCHLQKSGMRTFDCTREMTVRECTKDMLSSPIAFNTYTEFTTHVDNICFYVQSEMFQENTEKSVNLLLDSSEQVNSKLIHIGQETEKVKKNIDNSIEQQEKLLKIQSHLNVMLDNIKAQETKYFEDMKNSWHQVSTGLKQGIDNIESEQQAIHQDQSRWHKSVQEHFQRVQSEYKELEGFLNSGVASISELTESQQDLKYGMQEVQKEQIKSHNMLHKSLESHESIIKGQEDLRSAQLSLEGHVQGFMVDVQKKSALLESSLKINLERQLELNQQQELARQDLLLLQTDQKKSFIDAKTSLHDLLRYSEETTKTIHEHQQSFVTSFEKLFDTVRRVLTVHSALVGEFMDLQSILFYCVVVVVSYCVTSTKYTQNCRIWLFVAMSVNVVIEKVIVMEGLKADRSRDQIYCLIWTTRKVFIGVSSILLFCGWLFYKDYTVMCYQLLCELNDKLKRKQDYPTDNTFDKSKYAHMSRYALQAIQMEKYRSMVQELIDGDNISEESDAE
ncbi:2 TM domain-containing transmembrane protein [Acrasis kona]|uniref:2 TM domain-containing transmembrane protein n=1 Tax=Acrasis kona TaxID=1008807 RepID=A0AAW2ZGT6_9EUKA